MRDDSRYFVCRPCWPSQALLLPDQEIGQAAERSRCGSRLVNLFYIILWAFLAQVFIEVPLPWVLQVWEQHAWSQGVRDCFPLSVNMSLLTMNYFGVVLAALARATEASISLLDDAYSVYPNLSRNGGSVAELVRNPYESPRKKKSEKSDVADCSTAQSHSAGKMIIVFTVEAFVRGFTSVITSYLACVEHLADLLRRDAIYSALIVCAAVFVLGPLLYALAFVTLRRCLDSVAPCLLRRADACVTLKDGLNNIKVVLIILIIVCACLGFWFESEILDDTFEDVELKEFFESELLELRDRKASRGKAHAIQRFWKTNTAFSWRLLFGLMSVFVACVVSDLVAAITKTSSGSQVIPGLHWPTVVSNTISLIVGHIFVLLEGSSAENPGTLAALTTFRQHAGGAMSGYSGFSETVTLPILRGDWTPAMANWCMNVGIAVVFCAAIDFGPSGAEGVIKLLDQ